MIRGKQEDERESEQPTKAREREREEKAKEKEKAKAKEKEKEKAKEKEKEKERKERGTDVVFAGCPALLDVDHLGDHCVTWLMHQNGHWMRFSGPGYGVKFR